MSGIAPIPVSSLVPIEYRGERVITLSMMDQVHGRPEGTGRRNFNVHKTRLVEGRHYFEVTADEIRSQSLGGSFPPRTPKGLLLTERGYLVLVKSFTDSLAWQVQEQLVDGYFRSKAAPMPVLNADALFEAFLSRVVALLPSLIEGENARQRIAQRPGMTVGQVLDSWGVKSVKGLALALSFRLVRAGCATGSRAEMGGRTAKMFDPDRVNDVKSVLMPWCEQYVKERRGQGNLFPIAKAR